MSFSDMESIPSPYNKMRGVNYVFTYPSINADPPAEWKGVETLTVMWDNYDSDLTVGGSAADVKNQLVHLKKVGINTVRIWTSMFSWAKDKSAFNEKFSHFLSVCLEVGMHVMPSVFDSWEPIPTTVQLTSYVADWAGSEAKEYVDDLITATLANPGAVIIWDAFNEPWLHPAGISVVKPAIEAILAQIKGIDPSIVTSVGQAGWDQSDESLSLLENVNHDVPHLHPYGLTDNFINTLMADVVAVVPDKPVIASEFGGPGSGHLYEEGIDYCKAISHLGEQGIGWCIYMGLIGWNDPACLYPFQNSGGIIYHDGRVRTPEPVLYIRQEAINAGIDEANLFTEQEIIDSQVFPGDPDYVIQEPVPEGQGGVEWTLKLLRYGGYPQSGYESGNLSRQGRNALATALWIFTTFEILGLSSSPRDPYTGISRAALLSPINFVGTYNAMAPLWLRWPLTYSVKDQEVFLEKWRRALEPFVRIAFGSSLDWRY